MTVHPRELCSRLAPLAALLATLALAGCGVKGPLEPPPQAAAEPPSARSAGAPPASRNNDQFVLDSIL